VSRRFLSLLVAAAAIAPRLAVLLHERGAILADHTEKSDRFAQTFVDHGTFGFVPGEPSAYTQPLYGWFLVPIYWIFGRSWPAVGLAQIAVATVTALLVFALAQRLLSSPWAAGAAIAATLNPYLVWHDVHVNREILDQLLAVALVLATLRAVDRFTPDRAAVLGVVSGLAILGNTRLFALPVVLVAFVLWRRGLGRAALIGAATALVVTGVTVTPWLVRNRISVGCVALTTDGRALWKANNKNTHAVLARGGWIDDVPRLSRTEINPEDAYTLYVRDGRRVHVDECAQMTRYQNLALDFWVDHPGEKARLLPQAARMLWSPRVTETTGSPQESAMRKWVAPAYTILVYALAVVGIWFVPVPFAVLTLLLLAYNTIAALAFAGATRYRVSWDFLLVVVATVGVQRALGWLRRREPALLGGEEPT
jgi:4-amino-4-deoxy-L-arabinose transferase-like glycosyltransferase